MYRLLFALFVLTALSACTTTEIDEFRQGTTSINEGESIVILGRRQNNNYETEGNFVQCVANIVGSGKDGMEQLAGIWAYELSEMTAFRRTDSESVKQFFSTKIDRFRGAYGKYVRAHPRQVVI